MKPTKEQIHEDLHRWFKRGVTAAKVSQKINEFYGKVVIKDRTARKWFQMFRGGRKSAKRKQGSGRSASVDCRQLH